VPGPTIDVAALTPRYAYAPPFFALNLASLTCTRSGDELRPYELLRDYVTGSADVNVVLTMRNTIQKQKLLILRWYEDLASKIGYLLQKKEPPPVYVLGSPGIGKSYFRLYLARHLALIKYAAPPLALVFESVGKDASKTKPPFALLQPPADNPDASWTIIRMRHQVDHSAFSTALCGYHVVILQDVSHGFVRSQFEGAIIRHSSNNKKLFKLLREDNKDEHDPAHVFYVPGNTIDEAMGWFEAVVGRPPDKAEEVSAIKHVFACHGPALRNMKYLMPVKSATESPSGSCGRHVAEWIAIRDHAEQDLHVARHCLRCETNFKSEVKQKLTAEGVNLDTFSTAFAKNEEHLASDTLMELRTSFDEPVDGGCADPDQDDARYCKTGYVWRSNYVLQLAFHIAFEAATEQLAEFANRFNPKAPGVRGRLFETLFVSFFNLPPILFDAAQSSPIRLAFLRPPTKKRKRNRNRCEPMPTNKDPLQISQCQHGANLFTHTTHLIGATTCHFVRDEEDTKLGLVTSADADVRVSFGNPVLLMPYDLCYPGIDAVLLVQKDKRAKQKLALLLQVTFASRHSAKDLAGKTIAAWKARLEHKKFTVVMVYGIAPGQDYKHQSITVPDDAGSVVSVSIPQYSLQWLATGAKGNTPDGEADQRVWRCVINNKTVTCGCACAFCLFVGLVVEVLQLACFASCSACCVCMIWPHCAVVDEKSGASGLR